MVNILNWPFPPDCPPIPWDKKQQEEYERHQRQQVPSAPMVLGSV
jgi:hypothetical protein